MDRLNLELTRESLELTEEGHYEAVLIGKLPNEEATVRFIIDFSDAGEIDYKSADEGSSVEENYPNIEMVLFQMRQTGVGMPKEMRIKVAKFDEDPAIIYKINVESSSISEDEQHQLTTFNVVVGNKNGIGEITVHLMSQGEGYNPGLMLYLCEYEEFTARIATVAMSENIQEEGELHMQSPPLEQIKKALFEDLSEHAESCQFIYKRFLTHGWDDPMDSLDEDSPF